MVEITLSRKGEVWENDKKGSLQYQDEERIGERKREITGKNLKERVFIGMLVVLVLGLAGASYYLYSQYKKSKEEINNLRDAVRYTEKQSDPQAIVESVKKHILVPEDQPSVYVIQDVEAARKTYGDFFQNAQNGDRLLLFQKKAIIYRPTTDIIVNVGPVVYVRQGDAREENTQP